MTDSVASAAASVATTEHVRRTRTSVTVAACELHTVCVPDFEYELAAPTLTTDRWCGALLCDF